MHWEAEMNNLEAMQLLAMVKLAYPNSYRDLDAKGAKATANMWEKSFPDVPYPIMEQAFNSLRMKLKFPPTVAEMADEISHLHYETARLGDIQRQIGNHEAARQYYALSESISRFKNWPNIENIGVSNMLIGGDSYVGTSGNRLDRAHGLPQLDAGSY
jgi:hypothetical protein